MGHRMLHRVGPITRGIPSLALGLAVGIPVGFAMDVAAGFLVGWAAAAAMYSVWALVGTWNLDARQTRLLARSEAPGRALARVLAIVGSAASLAAVGFVLVEGRGAPGFEQVVIAGVCVVAVVASWLVIQVDYLLRIAAEYYGDPVGGIDFNQDDDPMYSDFAYLTFGVGVAYQVADTNVSSNRIRKLVIAQSLLGYLFGAVILATIVNLVSGLGG